MSGHRPPIISGHLKGILLITGAVFLLSLSDGLVKLSGARFGLAQLVLLRSLGATALIGFGALVLSRGLMSRRPLWVTLRSLCLVAMWFCYFAALPFMSLPLAAACYYSAPVWMALLSRLILREKVGGRRWIAILIAVTGVVLCVNPTAGATTPYAILPLLAAMFYALAAIVTWSRCRAESPVAMAFNLNVMLTLAGGLALAALTVSGAVRDDGFVFAGWLPLGAGDWMLALLLAVFLVFIALAVAGAYRAAPAPVVGVFDNAYLLFAALWSAVLFGHQPSATEWTGMALIAGGAAISALPIRRRPPVERS